MTQLKKKLKSFNKIKKDLAESIIQKGEVIINTLSKDEINSLFRL